MHGCMVCIYVPTNGMVLCVWYIRMYIRMYLCTYVRMYVCTYVRMYVCVCMYACTYVRIHVYAHTRTKCGAAVYGDSTPLGHAEVYWILISIPRYDRISQ